MPRLKSQTGFSLIEILLALVVVAAVALSAYVIVHRNHQAAQAKAIPAKIQTKADLKQASSALNSQPVDSSLDPTQLDKDVQNLY